MFEEPSDMGNDTLADPTCAAIPAARIESSMRPHCRQIDACMAKGAGHCRACTGAALWADPAKRQKTLDAIQRRYGEPGAREKRAADCRAASLRTWADPNKRASIIAAAKARMSVQDAKCQAAAQTPEAKAKRILSNQRSRNLWCPDDRYAEYRHLVENKRFEPGEARRIIEDDIAHHRPGRQEVARIAAELRAKHEREKAQRY